MNDIFRDEKVDVEDGDINVKVVGERSFEGVENYYIFAFIVIEVGDIVVYEEIVSILAISIEELYFCKEEVKLISFVKG